MAIMTAEPLTRSAPETQAKKTRPLNTGALYLLYVIFACLAFWPTLREMTLTWLSSSTYHHCIIVAPLALWMATQIDPPPASPRPSILALPLLAVAALLWLAGRAAHVNLVEELAFVSLLIAGVFVLFGPAYARRWAFPLLFLFFMVPFGSAFLPALQETAARGATVLLNASGVSAGLDGVLLTTSVGPFEIADACSGLNFLLAAAMLAAVYSWMRFTSLKKAAAFFALAMVLALAANVVRIYVVILAETLTHARYNISTDHIIFGWAFYGVLVFLLLAIGQRFADKSFTLRKKNPEDVVSAPNSTPAKATIFGALILIGAAVAYDRLIVERPSQTPLPTALPFVSAPGWLLSAPPSDWRAALDHADRRLYAAYQSGQMRIFLATGYFTSNRPSGEIAGYATHAFERPKWRKLSAKKINLTAFGANRTFQVETVENLQGSQLDIITIYWLSDHIYGDPVALKIDEARWRLLGKKPSGGVFYIAAPGATPDIAIASFLKSAEPLAVWLARIDATVSN